MPKGCPTGLDMFAACRDACVFHRLPKGRWKIGFPDVHPRGGGKAGVPKRRPTGLDMVAACRDAAVVLSLPKGRPGLDCPRGGETGSLRTPCMSYEELGKGALCERREGGGCEPRV